jgi:hypothetical protein
MTTIDDLLPDPQNRRTHPDRNRAAIRASLQDVGAARSIVIDETNTVLAGNGVVEAARELGLPVRIVESAGDEVIAVRRSGLDPEQKRRLAMHDNRTAELAEWDVQQLTADRDAGLDLSPFFSDVELGTHRSGCGPGPPPDERFAGGSVRAWRSSPPLRRQYRPGDGSATVR